MWIRFPLLPIVFGAVLIGASPFIGPASAAPSGEDEQSSSYYFVDDQKIELVPSDYVAVRFHEGADSSLSGLYPALSDQQVGKVPGNFHLFRIEPQTSDSDRAALLTGLTASSDVELVVPVFDAPGALMIVTDEFIAQFASGTDEQTIDQLNTRFGVEVVKQYDWGESVYLLRVQKGDALLTANTYHQLAEVAYAHPNFVRVRLRPHPVVRPAAEASTLEPNGGLLTSNTEMPKRVPGYLASGPGDRLAPSREESDSVPALGSVTSSTIKMETFEGSFPGATWTTHGDPTWDDTSFKAWAGSWSGYAVDGGSNRVAPPGPYPNDVNSWMVYGPFSLADAVDARVNLQAFVRTQYDSDKFRVGASINASFFYGDPFSGDWASFIGGNGFMNISIDLKRVPGLGNLMGQPQVWIALIFRSDSSGQNEGVYVDDIRVQKITGGYESLTSDTYDHLQWSLENNKQLWGVGDADVDASSAWGISHGSTSTVVAILDEGVDLTHEDLTAKLVQGYDATGGGSNGGPEGDDAHGTACAGIAAAITNNAKGVAGIARDARIMPVRIAYSGTGGNWVTTDAWIADAINWAVTNGADVLSNSWGGGLASTVINAAILNAKNNGRGGKGSVVLFASGNDNGAVSYPASNSNVLAVGALSPCDERKAPTSCDGEWWWGSNFGSQLDITAPGVHMYTTDISGAAGYDPGDYAYNFNGTSSATPVAAGIAALLLGYQPMMTAAEVEALLKSSADDLGPAGWDQATGWGRVNAFRALNEAPAPELIVESPGVSESTLTPGQLFLASATVRNQGTRSSAFTTLRYYSSTNNFISTFDSQIATDDVTELSVGSIHALGEFVNAPATDGNYWIGACVDPVSGESNTGNNCSSGVPIVVSSCPELPLNSDSVTGIESYTSCRITVGPDYSVSETGHLTLEAHTVVEFRSGTTIAGELIVRLIP